MNIHHFPEIPVRPDLKQGGRGDEHWVEIDLFYERAGVCVLLDQPERHSPYTRELDLGRDQLLRDLGLDVVRHSAAAIDQDPAGTLRDIERRVRDGLRRPRRTYDPPGLLRMRRNDREPTVNVTRMVAWLAGDAGAQAIPTDWPRHYDRDVVTWNYRPAGGALVDAPDR